MVWYLVVCYGMGWHVIVFCDIYGILWFGFGIFVNVSYGILWNTMKTNSIFRYHLHIGRVDGEA